MSVPISTIIRELLDEYGSFDMHKDEEGYTMSLWPNLDNSGEDENDCIIVISGYEIEPVLRQAWLNMVEDQKTAGGMH